ncbi:MAG: glycoside hydrolase family 15 protein, partial [Pseudorhodoplanes sp.]
MKNSAMDQPVGDQDQPQPDSRGKIAAIPRPISEHGAIGNLRTTALVARDGAIDFLCWPDFDSPGIFLALLDPDKGGAFELSPEIAEARTIQMYIPETNVLLTRWLGDDASAEITDLMPSPDAKGDCVCRIVRRVAVTRGSVTIRLKCWPRFDYARSVPEVTIDDRGAIAGPDELTLRLSTTVPLTGIDGGVSSEFVLRAGEQADFVFGDDDGVALSGDQVTQVILETNGYWQKWAARSNYHGRWRDAVTRSALALKLMTSLRHGSIVAAATFGLPESAGGVRNWDYRATWIRDASFTVYALMRLGYQEEAMAFTRWTGARTQDDWDGRLQIMYRIDGTPEFEETELDHLAGYGGARPIRVGNNASGQIQLDIYGELLDSIYISNKYGEAISNRGWRGVQRVVNHVCENWQQPDAGIWEVRNEPSEHLHSRLMCWVAVDRAIRLAQKRSLAAPFAQWVAARNDISDDIWANFWNAEKGHFVQTKGGSNVDGALLMMPLVRFISATDPAWLATLDAVGDQLADDSLV